MLHFGEIPKKFGWLWRKFSKHLATFGQNLRDFGKKQQKIQQFLTEFLRLESGAKECSLISKFSLKIVECFAVFSQHFADFARILPKCYWIFAKSNRFFRDFSKMQHFFKKIYILLLNHLIFAAKSLIFRIVLI